MYLQTADMYSFNIFWFRSFQAFEADKWKNEKKQMGVGADSLRITRSGGLASQKVQRQTQGSETWSARSEDPDLDIDWVISEPEHT
jgi:hypothetical protein